MRSGNEIRKQFIDFFCEKHGHTFVPSSPVVPLDDPTLLFTNAGMNQFKDVFLGTGTRPYKRAANTQKCIRAGGKHNDLDDVGKDTYHHTFFEMLGNWSFGDYFKKEAIQWAWELLTEVWKLDKTRLHVTVFEGDEAGGVPRDDEAADIWHNLCGVPKERIHYGNKKDNFWEMGNTGPCGPCTEIHIDRTPDKTGAKLVNADSPLVMEIWNLVFIQYNRNEDQSLTPLPAQHVDTGMGLERIVAVLQGKDSNYDTDLFTPIFDAIQKITGAPKYTGKLDDHKDTAYRVIADHIRMAIFAITDGARPGPKERESVVRSVIRRAVRFGYQIFDMQDPFLFELVPTVGELMGRVFPEISSQSEMVSNVLREEEEAFLRTIQKGIRLFNAEVAFAYGEQMVKDQFPNCIHGSMPLYNNYSIFVIIISNPSPAKQLLKFNLEITPAAVRKMIAENLSKTPQISGNKAFELEATHGFPIDLTQQMAEEMGITVDMSGYKEAKKRHEDISRGDKKGPTITAVQGDIPATDDSPKYDGLTVKAKVIGWVKENLVGDVGQFNAGDQIALLLDKTCFYAEQGGQVGDTGWIRGDTGSFQVEDTQKLGDGVLHIGKVYEGSIKVGQKVTVEVSGDRPHTMRNHTATHIMNWALRRVLGDHIDQKGSLVDAEKTRFDFSHDKPVSQEEIQEIERLVNEKIYADLPVKPITMPLADAKNISGVRAVFGEKYPDPVRVLLIGCDKPEDATEETSVEFCGGTHLQHTGQAGLFKIISQEAVGKGVRRLTAVTGKKAIEAVQQMATLVDDLTAKVNCKPDELPARVQSLQDEIKKLQQQLKKGAATDLQGAADKLFDSAVEKAGAKIIVGEMPPGPVEQMRNQVDRMRQKGGTAAVVVGWKEDDKVQLIVSVTDDLVKKGLHAGKIIGQIAKTVGGGGGGKPTMAQAGGKDPSKLTEAFQQARDLLAGLLD